LLLVGTLLAAALFFLLFILITQSASHYRSVLRVVGSEGEANRDDRTSAAVGMASGFAVVFLVAVLYVGLAQWHWFAPPPLAPTSKPLISPAPGQVVAPIVVQPASSPSPVPSASPSH
jgi:hypothetical protein